MSLYLQSSAAHGKAAKLKTELRGSDRIKMGGGIQEKTDYVENNPQPSLHVIERH